MYSVITTFFIFILAFCTNIWLQKQRNSSLVNLKSQAQASLWREWDFFTVLFAGISDCFFRMMFLAKTLICSYEFTKVSKNTNVQNANLICKLYWVLATPLLNFFANKKHQAHLTRFAQCYFLHIFVCILEKLCNISYYN